MVCVVQGSVQRSMRAYDMLKGEEMPATQARLTPGRLMAMHGQEAEIDDLDERSENGN